MSKPKIITNYALETDADLDNKVGAGIQGCTGNSNFTFSKGELTDVATAYTAYHNALIAVPTGNAAAISKKNSCRVTLEAKTGILCNTINLQANGDLTKLQSSGFPIAKAGTHPDIGMPINFKVEHGLKAGEFILSADNPPYTDHGMVFAFWNPIYGDAPVSIDDWFHRSCNGHKRLLTGFIVGKTYPFAAAYKGADTDPLIWGDVVMKTASN